MFVSVLILAPKLKGRPRRKRKKRSASPGESSNESEASVASTSKSVPPNTATLVVSNVGRPPSSVVRRSERNTSAEEKKFLTDVQSFMNSRGTPVGKMPLLGYRQSQYLCFFFQRLAAMFRCFLGSTHRRGEVGAPGSSISINWFLGEFRKATINNVTNETGNCTGTYTVRGGRSSVYGSGYTKKKVERKSRTPGLIRFLLVSFRNVDSLSIKLKQ